MMLTWRDKDDSLHSIPLASAAEVLKKFYADWPGGFAEIESALRTAANRAAKLDVSPNNKTTPCPTCSAPCTTKVLMRGGEHGWGTTDLERTQYSYAGAPKQVAGVERTFGYWQTHPEHEPLGDHSMVPLTDADKADGWTEVALGPMVECLTCNDQGAVGNILTAEPCPDCTPPVHGDDVAVDMLAGRMKAKLAKQRAKGYSGWNGTELTQQDLSRMLREHVDKGDPIDVANFCAFLVARGEYITITKGGV